MPTTSTGSPRSRSAAARSVMSARRRTSTAAVGGLPVSSTVDRQRAGERVGQPDHLRVGVREQSTSDVGRAGAVRGAQLVDVQAGRAQRTGDRVREREHLRRVAEARQQPVAGGGPAALPGEVRREARQVRRARAAPAVDRLHRVADRGDRHRLAVGAAEQRAQQDPLRVPGVLVLVEQRHAVALPLAAHDLRMGGRELRGERHLVGEVQRALAPLALARRPARAAASRAGTVAWQRLPCRSCDSSARWRGPRGASSMAAADLLGVPRRAAPRRPGARPSSPASSSR